MKTIKESIQLVSKNVFRFVHPYSHDCAFLIKDGCRMEVVRSEQVALTKCNQILLGSNEGFPLLSRKHLFFLNDMPLNYIESNNTQRNYDDKLFFKNGVVFIIKGVPILIPYESVSSDYFAKNVIDIDFEPSEDTFKIKRNNGISFIEWIKPFEEQPDIVKFIYNTGRTYWRKEQTMDGISESERREHDLNFINKIYIIGRMISQLNDKNSLNQIPVLYSKIYSPFGGKSLFITLISMIVRGILIPCFNIHSNKLPLDYLDFSYPKRNLFFADIPVEKMDDLVSRLTKNHIELKPLYKDSVFIPSELFPNVMIEAKGVYDFSESSISKHVVGIEFSDYYNLENSPESEFTLKEFYPLAIQALSYYAIESRKR